MPAFKVKVKWGKELFQDVEVNTEEEPMVFKVAALNHLNLPVFKVLVRGWMLKELMPARLAHLVSWYLLGRASMIPVVLEVDRSCPVVLEQA